MRTMNKTLAALTLGALLCAAGAAQARPVSAIATGTADIVFAASGTATIKITPVADLMAGSVVNLTKLANVAINVTAGQPAWRWTPGSGTIGPAASNRLYIAKGKYNTNNELSLALVDPQSNSTQDTTTGWWYLNKTATSKLHKDLVIEKHQTSIVAPDTYPVSVDAVVWAY